MPAESLVTDAGGPVLEAVVNIWREVFAGDFACVTADSNFFLCGGDSLDLMRVLVRVRERLGVELDLREAASFSTPRKMAQCCSGASQPPMRPGPSALLHSRHSEPSARFPATAGQRALWLAERISGASGLYNTAAVVHIAGALQIAALKRALSAVLQRHEVLRSRLRLELPGAQLVNLVDAACDVVLEPETVAGAAAPQLLRDAAAQPFDLETGPLWRFRLLQSEPRCWLLLVCVHHAVTDGWSGGVLLQHLADAYNMLLADPGWQPVERENEFRRWSLRQYPPREAELQWWRDNLCGADQLSSWPATGPHGWPFTMACDEVLLDGGGADGIRRAARALQIRPAAFFLTALRLALHALSGLGELCIGMPVNVRDTSAQEESVGYFVNLLPLRDSVAPDVDVGVLARRVQHNLGLGLSHRATAFADLAQRLRPNLLPSGNPWCDVLFAFQNLPQRKPVFHGLQTRVEPLTPVRGQYPLKVEIMGAGAAYACRIEYALECVPALDTGRLKAALLAQVASLCDGAARSS